MISLPVAIFNIQNHTITYLGCTIGGGTAEVSTTTVLDTFSATPTMSSSASTTRLESRRVQVVSGNCLLPSLSQNFKLQ